MNAGEFGRAGVSRANLVRPSVGELTHAGMVRGALPVAPSRESTQFTNRSASMAGMPRASENSHFFSRNAGSQASRVPFEQQRQSFNQATQRSFGNSAAGASNGAWRRAETPASQSRGVGLGDSNSGAARANEGSGERSNGGWQRFDPSSRGGAPAGSTAGQGSRGTMPGPGAAPQSRAPQQPVRISPSIVQNRGDSGRSAPRINGGGGSRSGGGGASRGGGGGHSGGHR
jgi:hypothetical protein